MEKEDFPLVTEWCNSIVFGGEYVSPLQRSRAGWEKLGEDLFEKKVFIIEKKDGSKIGHIWHFNMLAPYMKMQEIGYALVPSE